jgi:trigger factor
MTHTIRETGQWQHTISVEVPTDEVSLRMQAVARRFQKQASMPGFRKGKVPMDKITREYAAEIEREALDDSVREAANAALAEAGLRAVIPPSVENPVYKPGQPLTFDLVVEVAPTAEVKDWKGLPLQRRANPVQDEAVDAMVTQLREESAVFEDVDRPAGAGDVVLLDSQRVDANGRRLSGTLSKGARILLGAPDLLPELEAGLQGAEKGQERTVTVNYPADFRQQELAGQSVRYLLNIKAVQVRRLRELDDAFARDLFGLESLAALRDRVRQNLEHEDSHRVRRDLEAQAIEALIARNPIELSPRLVSYMLEQVIHEQTGGREDLSDDLRKQLEEHYRPGVERSLKREVLLIGIARQESLQVSEEEVSQQVLRMAQSDPRRAAQVRRHYSSPERRQSLAESILEGKALGAVVDAAQTTDAPAPAAGA